MERSFCSLQLQPSSTSSSSASSLLRQAMAFADVQPKEEQGVEADVKGASVAIILQKLKKQVQADRQSHVKMRMDTNRARLKIFSETLAKSDSDRKVVHEGKEPFGLLLLCLKSQQLLSNQNASEGSGDKDGRSGPQDSSGGDKPMAIIFGSSSGGKTAVRPIKLRKIENVPPYTTWIYLDRNQRMTEDQSVQGRRRIYYDSDGNETLIASDSEEEDVGDDDDKEELKHEFTKGEDSLIWMAIEEVGLSPAFLDELSDFIDIKREEIEARYEYLLRESDKKLQTGLRHIKVPETATAGISSPPGRRKTSTKDLARAAAKEVKEAAKESRASLKDASKDSEMEYSIEIASAALKDVAVRASARQAEAVDDAYKAEIVLHTPPALDEDKNEPKDLLIAMDSFDNLFCRRCLVFDCRLHGCSQAIVHPSERQQPWAPTPEEGAAKWCTEHCYLASQPTNGEETTMATEAQVPEGSKVEQDLSICSGQQNEPIPPQSEEGEASERQPKRPKTFGVERSWPSEQGAMAGISQGLKPPVPPASIGMTAVEQFDVVMKEKKLDKRLSATRKPLSRRVKRPSPHGDMSEVLKSQLSQEYSEASPETETQDLTKDEDATLKVECDTNSEKIDKLQRPGSSKSSGKRPRVANIDRSEGETLQEGKVANLKGDKVVAPESLAGEEEVMEDLAAAGFVPKVEVGEGWSVLEMGLYEKGLQIFGKNSCLIAANLLQGFKTCAEVAKYTQEQEAAGEGPGGVRRYADSLSRRTNITKRLREELGVEEARGVPHKPEDVDAASRARMYGGRRKGRVRKLKYTWKSVVHPLIRKRMANGKDQPCRQYTPCNCLYTCGKQCPCLLNGTCCEKYCGCSKNCKNRFRGCHCAKSQCCSRQCPCFAAGRECDPDVCRNCWVGCGDGSLGGPPPRGDNYECHNMKLMLKQQQRVLLGRSDVAGWGAFLKNPVGKHEYLGEYTGELISHREADKRGKIYDRENSSFLFNLNDQYVLDACRKGDKLKFANHSPQPNCYAKVIMVSGDHRVGIFAKERITAGEELFYDYRYEPDRAPSWAKKPDDPNNKREDMPSTSGRAQKAA